MGEGGEGLGQDGGSGRCPEAYCPGYLRQLSYGGTFGARVLIVADI